MGTTAFGSSTGYKNKARVKSGIDRINPQNMFAHQTIGMASMSTHLKFNQIQALQNVTLSGEAGSFSGGFNIHKT